MYITTRKVCQVLGSMFFGGLIGAGLMSIGIARSHADPGTSTIEKVARHICYELDQNPTEGNLISIVNALYDAGNTESQENDVMHYAMNVECPEYYPLAVQTAIDIVKGNITVHGNHGGSIV